MHHDFPPNSADFAFAFVSPDYTIGNDIRFDIRPDPENDQVKHDELKKKYKQTDSILHEVQSHPMIIDEINKDKGKGIAKKENTNAIKNKIREPVTRFYP